MVKHWGFHLITKRR